MAILNRHLSWDRSQSTEAQQVVGRSDQVGVQLHAGEAAEAGAAQAPVRLHPTEDLFDALALLLADPVARMARGANVEPCSAASVNLRDVRSEEHTSELQSQFHLVCRLLLEKKKKRTPKAQVSEYDKRRLKKEQKEGHI